MEEGYIEDRVRTRLILAGINELEEHGIKNFSLRRAALAAQVSCAAPYRHFKDKNEYIVEIVKYISSRRLLLCREIERAYENDKRRLVIELCMSELGFWLANSNFRSVLMLSSENGIGSGLTETDGYIVTAIKAYCDSMGVSDEFEMKLYTARAMIYGTVMLIGSGVMKNDADGMALVRAKLENEFK